MLLFAVTEFKPDSFGLYTGHGVILSFSFRPEPSDPPLGQKKIQLALSLQFCCGFQSNLQYNLQNIPFIYYRSLWIVFQEQFSSVSFFLNVTD